MKNLFSSWFLIFSSPTSFRAVNYIFPVFGPFLSPLKVSLTLRTFFYQFNFHFWFVDLNRVIWSEKPCFVFLPETLFLQLLKDDDLRFDLISWITSDSFNLNWNSIASKGVLSSQAISIIRSVSAEFGDLDLIQNEQFFFKSTRTNFFLCTYYPQIFIGFLRAL